MNSMSDWLTSSLFCVILKSREAECIAEDLRIKQRSTFLSFPLTRTDIYEFRRLLSALCHRVKNKAAWSSLKDLLFLHEKNCYNKSRIHGLCYYMSQKGIGLSFGRPTSPVLTVSVSLGARIGLVTHLRAVAIVELMCHPRTCYIRSYMWVSEEQSLKRKVAASNFGNFLLSFYSKIIEISISFQ